MAERQQRQTKFWKLIKVGIQTSVPPVLSGGTGQNSSKLLKQAYGYSQCMA